MINITPNINELIDIAEDWSKLPLILQTAVSNEAIALFPGLISDDIERLIDAFIAGGANADDIELLLVTIVSGTTANILTVSKVLNLATSTGSPTVISNVNSNVNTVYGTVVLDQMASNARTFVSSALLTYQTKFAAIGAAIGVAPAQQVLDDLLSAQAQINVLITLL